MPEREARKRWPGGGIGLGCCEVQCWPRDGRICVAERAAGDATEVGILAQPDAEIQPARVVINEVSRSLDAIPPAFATECARTQSAECLLRYTDSGFRRGQAHISLID